MIIYFYAYNKKAQAYAPDLKVSRAAELTL